MPKPLVNNRINYQNVYGRVIQHDLFLNQGVQTGDSPTFANLQVSGDTTIEGNLYVEGNTSIFNTNVVEFEDNIFLINRNETGSGVTLSQAGLEIERGSAENFRIVYNESNSRVEVGRISNLEPITIRESTPLLNGIMTWNNSTKRIESSNQIIIPISFTNTTNSISSTTGTVILNGGLGIKKDMYMDGKLYIRGSTHGNYSNLWTDTVTNNFNLTSSNDINLTPNLRVNIPANKYISFGNTNQNISADTNNSLNITSSGDINMTSSGDVYITPNINKKIRVPNQIPITFATDTEQIYTDSSNNMVIASSQDVYLYPNNGNANGKKVFIPVDTPLAFRSATQYIISNISNDLTIAANNNILLNPGATLDVKIPIDAGIKFGDGNQRITANSSNELMLYSQGDIYLTPQSGSKVNLPVSTHLTFASDGQSIVGDSNGNLTITSNNGSGTIFLNANVQINGTTQNVYSTVTNIQDPIFSLGGVSAPVSNDFKDRGIEFKWYGSRNSVTGNKVGFFGFNNSTQRFTYIPFATNSNEIITGLVGDVQFANGYFTNLQLSSTDLSNNFTSGSIVTNGGITIKCSTDATSLTNGGSLLTLGGASIGKSCYIGGSIYGLTDAFLGNLYFYTSTTNNYIQSPNSSRVTNSFLPINFTQYNNTNANTLTISDSKIVLNNNTALQIGGSLNSPDGYTITYTTNNLNYIPNTTMTNYNINIGTIGNYSNLNIYGHNSGQIRWQSTQSNLLMSNASLQLNKSDSSGSIVFTTPNNSSESYIQASGSNMTLNLGKGSTGGQLITTLSNSLGDATITFTPNNISSSTLVLTNVSTTFNSPVSFTNIVEYAGNALHQTVNNTSGNGLWIYMGQINNSGTGYCEIDFNNGINTSANDVSGLKLVVAINNTTCIASHSHYGNLIFDSDNKPICYIYKDASNNYQLFVKLAPNSRTNINVTAQHHNRFILVNEGISNTPSGTSSGYINTWTLEWSTQRESTLKLSTGDLTIEGNSKINDNLPIIGYNNINTTSSRDIGLLYERYQIANDLGTGDIVSDTPIFIDTIPSQAGISNLTQIKFSNNANSLNDFYNGYWIKISSGTNINQVRKIIGYNGPQRVATLETPLTTQNPNTGVTINFYNNHYTVNYYNETNDTFVLGYTNEKPNNGIVNINDNADLQIRKLHVTNTTSSLNSTFGSIYSMGGLSINNTNNASSSTSGGTITTSGGISVRKDIRIGDNLGIGSSGFTTEESIHIRKTSANIRLEHDTNSYSYIDFVENNTVNRYGILCDSQLSLTYTTNNTTPNNSNKALTINNAGYVGINTTTNINSPLVLNNNNFISTNSTTGYIGLIAGPTNNNNNTVGSRLVLFTNDKTINEGCINLYAGNTTSGNVSIFTNNDIERVKIEYNGYVNILSTQTSINSTTGALIVNGGISIKSTQNATSYTNGGSLTINGGMSVQKDTYIKGNVYIDGTVTAIGSITIPTLTSFNPVNCTFIEYYSNILRTTTTSTFGNLTFGFTVSPSTASENCSIEFSLPGRSTSFIKCFDVISTCSGYTDNTVIIPLMNVLSYGEIGTARLKIKFQSVSTSPHYFQVTANYIQI